MKKLNILYISLYLPIRNLHGGGTRMFEQIKYLSARHDVYLLSFVRDWEGQGLEPLKRFCKEVDVVRIEEKGLRSYSFTGPGFIKNYYSGEMESLVQKKTKEVDFDIVQFEYLPMAQYRDGLKARSILTEHQLGFLCLRKEMRAERNYFKKLVLLFRYNRLQAYEKRILNKFDNVVFLSSTEAGHTRRLNPFISSMGVDSEYFKPGDEPGNTDLIFTGNFDSFQNVDSMRYFSKDIWPLIKRKKPGANLKIAGFRSEEKLGFLKAVEGIEVVGYAEDMKDCINRARLFILPARIGGGMRGKLLEALSMQKPVVSTSLGVEGCEGDILRAIRIADAPQDFADKTIDLLDNELLRKEIGRIGRNAVERDYTWQSIFSKMDKVYEIISNNS